MYFPQRFRDWLLTCLPQPPFPHPEVYRFHLVKRGDRFTLEFRDQHPSSRMCAEPLPIPEAFCGGSNADCLEGLEVLFRAQMSRRGRIGPALGDRVVLHTPGGLVEIRADGEAARPQITRLRSTL
jgi:hypothetical protein